MLPLKPRDSKAMAGGAPIVDLRVILQVLWLPATVVLAATLLAALPGEAGPLVEAVPAYVPFGTALAGALLGWRFERSRALFALAILLLAYIAITDAVTEAPGPDPRGQVLYPGVAVLVPLNLVLIAYFDERGLFGHVGLTRLALILLQAALLAALTWSVVPGLQAAAAEVLHWRLLPFWFDRWTYLPQPALLAFCLTGVVLVGKTTLKPAPLEAGLLTALFAAGAGLHRVGDAPVPELYLTAAMVAVLLAVVQESYRMAFLDELTGLPGRRALQHEMKKLSGPYTIAMVDVDHFKAFNDRYGHEVGDQVLRMVAGCLARAPGAKAFRYGGEEFTLLYPGLDAASAREALETVRQGVAASLFRQRAKDRPKRKPPGAPRRAGRGPAGLSVTVSIGVAQRGQLGERPEDVLRAADLALYGAKRAGRNRVELYRPKRRRWQRPR